MKFFEPIIEEGYEWINLFDPEEHEIFIAFNGQLHTENWQAIKVRRGIGININSIPKVSDFPWLGSHALVLNQHAVSVLKDLLEPDGEILPLIVDDGSELFVYNAKVVDALDEPNSIVKKIPGTDRIMLIKKATFIESVIQGLDVFRLPHRASSTYVSEKFIERVKREGLVGLRFKEML